MQDFIYLCLQILKVHGHFCRAYSYLKGFSYLSTLVMHVCQKESIISSYRLCFVCKPDGSFTQYLTSSLKCLLYQYALEVLNMHAII